MPCSRSVGQPAVMYVAGTALPVATFKFLLFVQKRKCNYLNSLCIFCRVLCIGESRLYSYCPYTFVLVFYISPKYINIFK